MVAFLAAQLNVSPSVLDEYADRSQTRTDHLAEAMEALGFRAPGLDDLAHLGAWLLERALEHDQPSLLFQMAAEYLRTHKLVRPGVTAIRSTMTRSRISRRPCTPTSTSTASTGSTSTAYRPGSSGPAPVPPSADAGNPLALVSVHLLTGPQIARRSREDQQLGSQRLRPLLRDLDLWANLTTSGSFSKVQCWHMTRTMDHAKWLARAVSFAARLKDFPGNELSRIVIAPPATRAEVDRVEGALRRKLPRALAAFYRKAAAAVEIRYHLITDDGGGARVAALHELPALREQARGWARDTWIAEFPAERRWWLESLPFIALDSGDMVGLGPRGEVVALVHDDEAHVIAPSFDRFLDAWQRLAYVEPSWWAIRGFLNQRTGYMYPEGRAGRRMRANFVARATAKVRRRQSGPLRASPRVRSP